MALASCSLLWYTVLFCHVSRNASASRWKGTGSQAPRSSDSNSHSKCGWNQTVVRPLLPTSHEHGSRSTIIQQTLPRHLLWAMHLSQLVGLGSLRSSENQDHFTEATGKKELGLDRHSPQHTPQNAPFKGLGISKASLKPHCPRLETTASVNRPQQTGETDRQT